MAWTQLGLWSLCSVLRVVLRFVNAHGATTVLFFLLEIRTLTFYVYTKVQQGTRRGPRRAPGRVHF